ncbi:MAG: hypothetical protein AAGA62_18530, partial [Bacteroidota bacterium]
IEFNFASLQISYNDGGDVTLTAVPSEGEAVWSGTVSSDWYTAANWFSNQVPQTEDKVIILPAPNPAVLGSGEVTVEELEVDGGGFTLVEGATLNLSGGFNGYECKEDGETLIGGTLIVSEQNQAYSFNVNGRIEVTETGQVEILGVGGQSRDSLILDGNILISTSRLQGLVVFDGAMVVGNSGTAQINKSNSQGLVVRGGAVVIDGMMMIDSTDTTGFFLQSSGAFTIGATGSLSITDSSLDGINILGSNPVINEGLFSISGSVGEAVDGGGTVSNQATATFRVEGTIDADIQFAAGSRFEPGTSPGCVTFEDPADLGATTLAIEIEGTEACADYDQVVFEAGTTVAAASLELSGSYVPQLG